MFVYLIWRQSPHTCTYVRCNAASAAPTRTAALLHAPCCVQPTRSQRPALCARCRITLSAAACRPPCWMRQRQRVLLARRRCSDCAALCSCLSSWRRCLRCWRGTQWAGRWPSRKRWRACCGSSTAPARWRCRGALASVRSWLCSCQPASLGCPAAHLLTHAHMPLAHLPTCCVLQLLLRWQGWRAAGCQGAGRGRGRNRAPQHRQGALLRPCLLRCQVYALVCYPHSLLGGCHSLVCMPAGAGRHCCHGGSVTVPACCQRQHVPASCRQDSTAGAASQAG